MKVILLCVFFYLACFTTCCWGLPKPKYEPFINNNNNNNNLLHLYSAFLDTQSALHSKGGISSSTTNVQHPPG